MLESYIKQILSLYNYIDAIVMIDNNGVIKYLDNFRTDIYNLYAEEVIGKYIWDIYPNLNEVNSSLLRVLKSGKAILNEKQQLINYKGIEIHAVNSTFPIKSGNKIIGVVEVSAYIDYEKQRRDITLQLKERNEDKSKNYNIDDIVTNDNKMLDIKKKILKISESDSSVLIYGHTGTGKEMIAQSIHRNSYRADKPFISQNCAAIPSILLESILFGTVKDSYTGAENRKGLFETADGGTLFLDEINSMEMFMQAKLLKSIENQEIRRVGSAESIKVDVRIISAVNEPPLEAIYENRLREDLFYRIGVVQINLPDLKDRKKDIELLLEHFIKGYNDKMKKAIKGIDESVRKILKNYKWPGNVRELKNVIEFAFNLTYKDIITVEDLPDYIFSVKSNNKTPEFEIGNKELTELIQDYEKNIIEYAIESTRSITKAAQMLKISRQSLNYKISKYNINR
ncbi:sigma 54-interacting transcriptional regulator [Clostridiaceae bacterium UIB06]|uniref:Sigma 54-interacting transcriptional regulator n=1 Tax=Clostridium thailandense TaxID=2794346 RepID=A0A949TLQ4_9CLOT|nr:sigma 54-interacting transcriptional regulator [Clostridium thailandense]MBV7275184.1 sigma 54-interacting transcriptional regulator [Clostridium thailandense]MCH5137852.1 sigma 54-interacting transcriptional regulator [Clostridiaceae bacterium UIB06]